MRIVTGLSTLLPLELIGAHVASGRSRTTGRQHDLALRLAVALFGHQGIEWDITTTTPQERVALAEWARLAKSMRPLLHRGALVRLERPSDPGTAAFGVVAQDRSEAIFALVRSQTIPVSEAPPLRFDGLEPGPGTWSSAFICLAKLLEGTGRAAPGTATKKSSCPVPCS